MDSTMEMQTGLVIPPSAVDAEQAVLGGLLIDNGAIDRIQHLEPAHFYRHNHRELFAVMRSMLTKGDPVDIVTVAEELGDKAEALGGIMYLGTLAQHVPTAANIRKYAEAVIEKSQLRDLLTAAARITEIVSEAGEVASKINQAQAEVMRLSDKSSKSEPKSIREILTVAVEAIDRRSAQQIDGLMTGMRDLDEKLHGIKNGELIIIAARPAMGKSTLAVQIAEHVARDGNTALVLSQEMTYQQIADRLIASAGRVSMGDIITGQLTDEGWQRVSAAVGKLHELPLFIDEQGGLTLADVCAKARMIKRKHGLSLLVVDYLQLMSGNGDSRNAEIEVISRGLKSLAKELHIPVIALSQLSRECEKRPNKRPHLSDLRDSGAIEQDADVVLFIYRDEIYNPDSMEKGIAEILIRKNRQGATGDVRMVFAGEFSRFDDLAFGYEPPVAQPKRRRVEYDL